MTKGASNTMAEVIPFKGLRYNTDIVGDISRVTTPPYDIISGEEQENFYRLSPYNSIRLELPKELPGDDSYNNKYTRAGESLEEWIDKGVLLREKKDCFYIYQQEFQLTDKKSYTRTGLIGLLRLEEFEKGIVLPHENTLSKPKLDRLQLMRSCNANFSQIFGLYDDPEQVIPSAIEEYRKKYKPGLVTDKGIANNIEKIWVIDDSDFIKHVKTALKDKRIYIADGHHRYETALAYRNEMRSQNPNHNGDEPYNFIMVTLVEMGDPGLIILPTHRMVKGIKNFNIGSFISKLREDFEINKHDIEDNRISSKSKIIQQILDTKGSHTFVLYEGESKSIFSLTLKSKDLMKFLQPKRDASYCDLDVSILHTLILDRFLGIGEKELANQENLEYTHSIWDGIEGVDKGNQQMTFFMSATAIRQIQDISLANEKMPQKSTYFYPKLLTGLVFNGLTC